MISFILAAAIPSTFIIPPGVYEKNNTSYECLQEGVYRFGSYGNTIEQRIVYKGDLFRLLESITWVQIHGFGPDAKLSIKDQLEVCKKRKISIACGDIARLTKAILDSVGVQSRVVQWVTLEQANGYNDGHLMIEVYHRDRWVLVDIDQRVVFLKKDHQMASAAELLSLGIDGVKINKFSQAPLLSYSDLKTPGGKDVSLLWEDTFIKKDLKPWYKRVCQKYYYP